MLKKIIIILLTFILLVQPIFATNEIVPSYDLLQQGINMPLADPLMNDITMNNTIEVHQPLPTDVLSYNAEFLNNNVNNFQTEQIFQPIDMTLNQTTDPTLDLLNSTMKDLEDLEKEKKTIISGYLYKYEEKEITNNSNTLVENINDKKTEEVVKEEQSEIQENVEIDTNNPFDTNVEDNNQESATEIDNISTSENLEDFPKPQKSFVEYYTIVNKSEYIQLIPGDEVLKKFFELVAGKDILLEFVCEKQENGSFLVVYVSCIEELPENIKNELKKLEEELSKIVMKKGVFVAIEEKVYFLEETTDKIYLIGTKIPTIEEIIFYLTDKGIKTEIEILEEEDYINILSITIPEDELTKEEFLELELMVMFDTSKVYNFTAPIIGDSINNSNNYIYYVKIENKEYILNTQDTNVGDVIVSNANTSKNFYMEGYLGKESPHLFYVKYIELK